MRDLTPEEREALLQTMDEIASGLYDETAPSDDAEYIAASVKRFLAAVPRLREVEGMGLAVECWAVRDLRGHVVYPGRGRDDAVALAAPLNRTVGPGHHAVRLAVVEVATPDTKEEDDATQLAG